MLTVQMSTLNAAMREPEALAVHLEEIALSIRAGETRGNVRDLNGNRVGTWSLEIEPDEED